VRQYFGAQQELVFTRRFAPASRSSGASFDAPRYARRVLARPPGTVLDVSRMHFRSSRREAVIGLACAESSPVVCAEGTRGRCAGTRGGCRAHRSLLGRRGGPHKDGSGYTERDVATVVRWPTWMIEQSRFPGGLSRCTGRERNARSALSVHRAVSCACNGRCLCGESGLS